MAMEIPEQLARMADAVVAARSSEGKSRDELRDQFLRHVWHLIDHWETSTLREERARLEGLAFSILSSLDGAALALPGYHVIPVDTAKNCDDSGCTEFDISGDLHDHFRTVKR